MDLNNLDNNNIIFDDNNNFNVDKVHIRKTQRNRRQCITTVEGLENDLDIKKITRALKKIFQCNGAIMKDDNNNEIIQLSGDQRERVKEFLVNEEINKEHDIIIH